MPTVDEFRLKKIGRIPMSYFKHRYLQSLNNKFLRSTEWFRTPILVAKTDAVDYSIRDPIPTTSQGRKTTVTIAFTTNQQRNSSQSKTANNAMTYVYIGVGAGALLLGTGGVIFLIKWIHKKKKSAACCRLFLMLSINLLNICSRVKALLPVYWI